VFFLTESSLQPYRMGTSTVTEWMGKLKLGDSPNPVSRTQLKSPRRRLLLQGLSLGQSGSCTQTESQKGQESEARDGVSQQCSASVQTEQKHLWYGKERALTLEGQVFTGDYQGHEALGRSLNCLGFLFQEMRG
jgi:hypothetical protein